LGGKIEIKTKQVRIPGRQDPRNVRQKCGLEKASSKKNAGGLGKNGKQGNDRLRMEKKGRVDQLP